KRVKFHTLTERAAAALEEALPGRFEFREDRDLAEYVYRTESMATFSGIRLKKRRNEVNSFWSRYAERAAVTRISSADFADMLAYEYIWLRENSETHDSGALEREARMVEKQLRHFDELHLSGVILRIDEEVHGFSYGTALSESCYDAIAEKGDRAVLNVYKVLRQESVKQCAMEYPYVNLEEDVGVQGLRDLKNAYQPEYLLHKYIATER
ncbi:MAG: DUF2156 domain-containing protein, partial [Oscillibacter sp.]|nr:DUF2156 domain-containing protein [Oscillibacter sp.]